MTTKKTKTKTKRLLEALTPAQERLMDEIAEEYISDAMSPKPPVLAAIRRWIRVVYGLYDRPPPERVEIAASPQAALRLATELTGETQSTMDWTGVADAGWAAFYDYMHRIGVLSRVEAADVLTLRAFLRCAWDTVLLDECAIVVRRPVALRIDDAGELHCADGPCIEWADGQRDYAWHGTWVPERVIVAPRDHTRAEYDAITNTEVRRALCEHAGWDWTIGLLGAEGIDAWTDPDTGLAYALLRTSDGQKMLRQQSPKLADGSQPTYIEPVHEDLTTAAGARKWQATSASPRECDADPALVYEVEA